MLDAECNSPQRCRGLNLDDKPRLLNRRADPCRQRETEWFARHEAGVRVSHAERQMDLWWWGRPGWRAALGSH
jgi:hypothetical protein